MTFQRYQKHFMKFIQNAVIKTYHPLRWFLVIIVLTCYSCSPVRRVPEGKYLLKRIVIKNNKTILSDGDMQAYVRQKPNRKIAGIYRFHLQVYSLVDKERFEKRYAKRLKKREELNEKRKLENKPPRNAEPQGFSKWLLQIGEAPVLVDTLLISKSTGQIELLLKNNGYFEAEVEDSVILVKNKKYAIAEFKINAGIPFKLNQITYDIHDDILKGLIMADTASSLIKKGNLFQTELMDKERDRITDYLKNLGYFAFNRNYLSYSADSTVGNRKVDLEIHLTNPLKRVAGMLDSNIELKHLRYKINDIYIQTNYKLRPDSSAVLDTLYFDDVHFISQNEIPFRPKTIRPAILLKKGELFSKKLSEFTYGRLSDYRSFKFINVQFVPEKLDSSDKLNVEIQLSPMAKQSFSVQTQGTNTAGNFGVAFDFVYQNKNLLKGLELFEFRINSALEVQQILSDLGNEDNSAIIQLTPFNTILLGPEASLVFPRFILPFKINGNYNPKTRLSTSFNYQQRSDYERTIFNLSYGYTWKRRPEVTQILNPSEINFVNVRLSDSFAELLDATNNIFLRNSFRSQLITAIKYSYIYSNQASSKLGNFLYFRGNLEHSGFLLSGSREFYANPGISDDKFIVFGVPYSQYLRFDADVRKYFYATSTSSFAFRGILGLGLPYGNSSVMPFEKSFFVGGANGIRAWIARSLGPGGYANPGGVRFDQTGDIKLEWNAEYRFKVYKLIESAFFIDAGNVWLSDKDPARDLAHFEWDRFYKEIAIGGGMGLRLNFDFFIIRLDAAHPLRDPARPVEERWVFNNLNLKRVNFNFGIGYPF